MFARSVTRNGAPANVIYGTKDDSLLPLVLEPVAENVHVPLCFGFAPKGEGDKAHMLSGNTLIKMHGIEVIQNGNKYSTFNTPFVKLFNEKANTLMFHRLQPDDAETPTLRLYVETFTKEIDVPERDAQGNILYKPGTTEPLSMVKVEAVINIWRIAEIADDEPVGKAAVMDGTNTNVDGTKSKIYPIYDIPGPYFGEYARNFRFSFACLNSKSQTAVDKSLISRLGHRVFRMTVREATPSNAVGNIVTTLKGGSGVSYAHAHNLKDEQTNVVYDYRHAISRGYINKRPTAGMPAFAGPFKEFFCYEENLNTVINQIAAAEGIEPGMVDPFTCLDMDGVKYTRAIADAGDLGGEVLNEAHYYALMGGADGTMNNEVYDLLVRREMERFGDGPVKYLDMLRYPCSFLWDSGFTLETKEVLANFQARRPDCTTVSSTFVYNQPSNDIETETSMALAIAAFQRAYPESQRYSTPALRAYLVGQDYILNDESYLDRVPLIYHLASLLADYAGKPALDGDFRFFDGGEYTVINTGYDVSIPWKPNSVYENDYDNGLIYAISYDDHRHFFPALRSVYNIPRSVLVGMLPALVCGDLIKVSQRVWAETTGNQTMDEDEYADYVAQKIINKTTGKYDTVRDIRPVVYFTDEDRSAGNQCTIEIYVAFNTTKTLHKVTVVAQREGYVDGVE